MRSSRNSATIIKHCLEQLKARGSAAWAKGALQTIGLFAITAVGLAITVSAQIPITPVPAGYGRYCSLSFPNGGWALGALPSIASDPCGDMKKQFGGGKIERAGLWDTDGENNVLVRCDGDVGIYRATGGAPIQLAFNQSQGKKSCVFTISPKALPVFSLPYGKTHPFQFNPSADVSVARGFDYNVYNDPWDVTLYGQQPNSNHPEAHWVDRLGQQRCFVNREGDHVDGEPAYDWPMPAGKPLLAVADGYVVDARWRDVEAYGCGSDKQGEIYIHHQIGNGEYEERFITYYAHMSEILVEKGQLVTRGQKIGEVGNTGCSGGNHLHFGVLRLTNLSGKRIQGFWTTPDGYGVNTIANIIDPFGWNAPQHIDPWAWRFLGTQNDPILGTIKDPGAFSINLWRREQAPPSSW